MIKETPNFAADDVIIHEVADDVAECFSQPGMWLDDLEVRVDPIDSGPMRSESHAALTWTVVGHHRPDDAPVEERRSFLGLRPTLATITIHGVSIVRPSDGELLYTRLIDWSEVFAQLGMMPNRPVADHIE